MCFDGENWEKAFSVFQIFHLTFTQLNGDAMKVNRKKSSPQDHMYLQSEEKG